VAGATARVSARAVFLALVAAAWAVTVLVAQEGPTRLTLDDAIRIAKDNNPQFLSQTNDMAAADWAVRSAYGAFLPNINASGSMSFQEAGVQNLGTVSFGAQSTDWYSSGYSLTFNWNLNGNTLFGVRNARASQDATSARIDAAAFTLESAVTLQYMTALRAGDGVAVAQRQLDRTRQNFQIVQNRVESGASAGTEGKQSEVDLGRAEVALIQAEQAFRTEKLRLMEQLGIALDEDVELASGFDVFEPTWQRDELVSVALEAHPSLNALTAAENAARAGVRQSRSAYFPSLNLSTGFRGFTNQALSDDYLLNTAGSSRRSSYNTCMRWQIIQEGIGATLPGVDQGSCGAPQLTEEQNQQVLAGNDVFPFDFTKSPLSLSASVSVPIFQGFSRQRQVEQAVGFAKDAEHSRRAEELRLRREVTEAHGILSSAYRIVRIEERNRALAEERLEAARQRYAIGAAPSAGSAVVGSSFLELLDAQTSMATAERDYLNAVYGFHQALARLEAATGRSLRTGGAGGAG
jgi:outer membrane protein